MVPAVSCFSRARRVLLTAHSLFTVVRAGTRQARRSFSTTTQLPETPALRLRVAVSATGKAPILISGAIRAPLMELLSSRGPLLPHLMGAQWSLRFLAHQPPTTLYLSLTAATFLVVAAVL